jgi:hypothetical protein
MIGIEQTEASCHSLYYLLMKNIASEIDGHDFTGCG